MDRKASGLSVKITSLALEQFRGFNILPDLVFNEDITVIISENGGGKTTILDAIANALQVFVNQLTKSNFTNPELLGYKNIRNGSNHAYVELIIEASKSFSVELFEQETYVTDQYSSGVQVSTYDSVILNENKISVSINSSSCERRINNYVADEQSIFSFREYFVHEYRKGDFLPVLVYYGCNSIDTQSITTNKLFEGELYHIYANSLSSERFSFDSFLRWIDHVFKSKFLNRTDSREWDIIYKVAETIMNDDDDRIIYSNLRMDYKLEGDMLVIDKTEKDIPTTTLGVDQLSSGEKVMFAIAMDITKRLIIANPDLLSNNETSPLEGQGIVLIDEIDLHLHPKWQRVILPKLLKIFPNIQFVVTTHSPFVVQSVLPKNCLKIDNGKVFYFDNYQRYDYEEVAIDFFGINNFFDVKTTDLLLKFRLLVKKILKKEITKEYKEFVNILKELSQSGESVRSVVAFELSQMEQIINDHV